MGNTSVNDEEVFFYYCKKKELYNVVCLNTFVTMVPGTVKEISLLPFVEIEEERRTVLIVRDFLFCKYHESIDHVTHALEFMTEEEGKEFQEFRRSIGIVGTFTKQMVKMAIAQLKPEFENMAVKAAEQAFDNKMTKVRELNEELNKRERELKQLRLEKKILQAKLDKERVVKSRPDSVETKEKELKRMEADISNLKMKLRKTTDDLKHERDRLSEEEKKRLELESTLQADVERLRKELDRVKGQLGQLRSAKNVGDDETRKLRERERQLLDEMEMIRKQQPRLHKRKLFA